MSPKCRRHVAKTRPFRQFSRDSCFVPDIFRQCRENCNVGYSKCTYSHIGKLHSLAHASTHYRVMQLGLLVYFYNNNCTAQHKMLRSAWAPSQFSQLTKPYSSLLPNDHPQQEACCTMADYTSYADSDAFFSPPPVC